MNNDDADFMPLLPSEQDRWAWAQLVEQVGEPRALEAVRRICRAGRRAFVSAVAAELQIAMPRKRDALPCPPGRPRRPGGQPERRGGGGDAWLDAAVSDTQAVVQRMLEALDNEHGYDLGVCNHASGLTLNYSSKPAAWVLSASQIKFLRAKNSAHAMRHAEDAVQSDHIYIRPSKSRASHLVLADDLSPDKLAAIKSNGWQPAIVVQTSVLHHLSPQQPNLQVWFKCLPAHGHGGYLTPGERTLIARFLAEKFGADPGSAESAHYGRLAGFGNPKPERRDPATGRAPVALIVEATGAECAGDLFLAAQKWSKPQQDLQAALNAASKTVSEIFPKSGLNVAARIAKNKSFSTPDSLSRLDLYAAKMHEIGTEFRLKNYPDASSDRSTVDWFVACASLGRGYALADVIRALSTTTERDARDNYLRRTVQKASIWIEAKRRGELWDDVSPTLLSETKRRFDGVVSAD